MIDLFRHLPERAPATRRAAVLIALSGCALALSGCGRSDQTCGPQNATTRSASIPLTSGEVLQTRPLFGDMTTAEIVRPGQEESFAEIVSVGDSLQLPYSGGTVEVSSKKSKAQNVAYYYKICKTN